MDNKEPPDPANSKNTRAMPILDENLNVVYVNENKEKTIITTILFNLTGCISFDVER